MMTEDIKDHQHELFVDFLKERRSVGTEHVKIKHGVLDFNILGAPFVLYCIIHRSGRGVNTMHSAKVILDVVSVYAIDMKLESYTIDAEHATVVLGYQRDYNAIADKLNSVLITLGLSVGETMYTDKGELDIGASCPEHIERGIAVNSIAVFLPTDNFLQHSYVERILLKYFMRKLEVRVLRTDDGMFRYEEYVVNMPPLSEEILKSMKINP